MTTWQKNNFFPYKIGICSNFVQKFLLLRETVGLRANLAKRICLLQISESLF
jgi:hypothetical protein